MNSETLAAWYLRLNGFLTIPAFVIHPGRRGGALSDADVVGVRFPFRREFPGPSGGDDPELTDVVNHQTLALFAEVKTGRCAINASWLRDDTLIGRVLGDLGFTAPETTRTAASELRTRGISHTPMATIRLAAIGEAPDAELRLQLPAVLQMTWSQVGDFIYNRLRTYQNRKTDHSHWDESGRLLWELVASVKNPKQFKHQLDLTFRVRST